MLGGRKSNEDGKTIVSVIVESEVEWPGQAAGAAPMTMRMKESQSTESGGGRGPREQEQTAAEPVPEDGHGDSTPRALLSTRQRTMRPLLLL